MALFGDARRSAGPEPPASPVPFRAPAAGDGGERLLQQLREIAAGTVAPEEAFEPALRAILQASGAAAGALCLYDQRHEMLRLAAEVGLSDDGCRRLRSVRSGDAVSWDMPLHGLLNRRVYLIDSASKNRYVPRLVDGSTSVRTVACAPLLAGTSPLGSLVLITLTPQIIGERDIRTLQRPLHELVKIIEAVRRHSPGQGAPPVRLASPASNVVRPVAPEPAAADAGAPRPPAHDEKPADVERSAELERLRVQLAEAEAMAAHERRLREELEAAQVEREASAKDELQRAREQARVEEAARHEAVAEAAAAEALVRSLREELAARGDVASRLSAVVAERDELRRLLETARGERDGVVTAAAVLMTVHAVFRHAVARPSQEPPPPDPAASAPEPSVSAAAAPVSPDAATPTPAPSAPVMPSVAHAGDGLRTGVPPAVVVLDADAAWDALSIGGQRVTALAPDDRVGEHLEEIRPAHVLVNLAAGGALGALHALRASGSETRVRACIASPRTGRALALGIVDVAPRPIDPDLVVAALARSAARRNRIITVGPDVEALISLRQALTRQGMSVSRAWDAKQAADLLAMMRPDVVLVDLELARQGCGIVAALSAVEPVPVVLLVPGQGDPAEDFAATLAEPEYRGRAVPLERALADAVRVPTPTA